MSDAYRTSKTIVFSLDMRQVSGIIAGSMAILVITFALGVGFGHRLATGAIAQTHPVDLKKLDEKPPAPPVYTFAKELATPDPGVASAPAAKPKPAVAADTGHTTVAEAPKPTAVLATVPDAGAPTPVPAPPSAESEAPKKDTQDRWTVQFGAPARQKDADKLVQQLKAFGYDPFVAEADIEGKGHVYRVRIGRFPTRQEADRFRTAAKHTHNVEGLVMSAPAQ